MIPLYTNNQIAQIDLYTIKNYTSSLELISRASRRFIHWLEKKLEYIDNVHIMCGPGNNGADGYQIAIHLAERGISVHIFTLNIFNKLSGENRYFRKIVDQNPDIRHQYISTPNELKKAGNDVVCVDAVLGNGISRPVEGTLKELLSKIQNCYSSIYAVDVPSGLMTHDQKTEFALHATATFSFEFPKLSFFDPVNEQFTGPWEYNSIGLVQGAKDELTPIAHLVESIDIAAMLKQRLAFSHKGMTGGAMVMAGALPMPGAIRLVADACVSCGAGYTYLFDPTDALKTLSDMVPELIRIDAWDNIPFHKSRVISVGPGFGMQQESVQLIEKLLNESKIPLVLDADALNIIAKKNWLEKIPAGSILTPHIKEFERLFGAFENHFERIAEQKKRSSAHRIVIILKGRYTSITTPEGELFYNPTGNPGLAKGGSGDVLTGILTALRAQGYDSYSTATIGVYLHGLCGDIALRESHEKAICPSHLKWYIGKALRKIQQLNHKQL